MYLGRFGVATFCFLTLLYSEQAKRSVPLFVGTLLCFSLSVC